MGKISQVSSKYIINDTSEIEGVVERLELLVAIFGQTEGLLVAELDLIELNRSGQIGRIERTVDTKLWTKKGTINITT